MTPHELVAKYNREILFKVLARLDNSAVYTFVTERTDKNGIPYNLSIIEDNQKFYHRFAILVKDDKPIFRIEEEEYGIPVWGDEWGKFVLHLKSKIGKTIVFEQILH